MTRAVARAIGHGAGRASPAPARPGASAPARRTAARMAVGRAATALGQWLRRPLTSLHLVLGVFGLLTLFGLVMVLSASSVEAYTGGRLVVLGVHQAAAVLRARAGDVLRRAADPAAAAAGARARSSSCVCVVLLIAVLAVGVTRNGSRRLVRGRVVHRAALGGGEGGAHAVGGARAGGAAGGDAPVEVRAVAGRAGHGRAVHAARAGARPRHDGHARHRAGRAAVLRGRAAAADGRAAAAAPPRARCCWP